MKKFYFLAALVAGTALTSCTSEDDLALSPPEVNVEDSYAPIVFSSVKNNITRGDITGKDAADSLGGKFVVSGFKGEKTATPGSMVFDNYLVEYGENTANTTESNSDNWEYVGKGLIDHAVTNGITKQTIKYWDYSQPQYDFIAWSTGKAEAICSGNYSKGQVLVSSITPNGKDGNPAWATGMAAYTFSGLAEDLKDCYIADLVTVKKGEAGEYGEVNKGYGLPVTLKFRQLGTKVRIGIYETVPGYSVKNVKFYKKAGALTDVAKEIVDTAIIFSTAADIYTEGTYTVYFPTVDKPDSIDNNQAHILFAPKTGTTQTTTVNWGKLKYTYRENGEKSTEPIYLGRTSNTATYAGDSANNFYVFYLPNEAGANLNLRVDFTLESIDGGGEVIHVKNAKATVPNIYTAWKPGYAYTYLFKISDKTNGRTGAFDPTLADDATLYSDPEGLYPITFDAVVMNAEEGNSTQETITLIATPSITTYQQYSTVVNANEYKATEKDIFVTVNEGENMVELTDKAALYTIPSGMTEAEVIDALTYQDNHPAPAAGTIKGRSGKVLNEVTKVTGANDLTTENTWMLTDSVKFGANGNAIKVRTDQALRFKPIENNDTTYAFVYTKTAATKDSAIYKAVTKAYDDPKTTTVETAESVKGLYRYKLVAATPDKDVQKDTIYFRDDNASSAAITAFLGQNVDNLFTRSGSEGSYVYTPARGYAQTGVDYYYTTNGQTYTKAEPIAYASFSGTTLYTDVAHTNAKPAGEPVNGQAYYTAEGKYCVIYPQRTNGLYVFNGTDTTKEANMKECSDTDVAVKGMTYFDRYSWNNAERYVKVIKIAK